MRESLDALALYDSLPPDERAALDRAMEENPPLAEAFRTWQSLRASVRRDLAEALPDRALLVLYALADDASADALSTDESARLDAARADLDSALDRHPGLVDAVHRIRADRDAFEGVWAAHATPNGETARPAAPVHRMAADRPAERPAAPVRPMRRVNPVWRVAALVAVVLFGALLVYVVQRDAPFDTVQTAEAQTLRLPDGSTVELAAGTTILIPEDDADDLRRARLLAGQALFTVRHDPSDPFTVETPNAVVTVLGTTFGLEVGEAETDVVLVNGAVAFASKADADAAVTLAPGERSRVVALDAPSAPAPADLDASLDWTGDLFFRAEPVAVVAARLADAFGAEIAVDDALASEMVSVTRFERDAGLDAALDELAITLGARVEREASGYRLVPEDAQP